jgi:hypothetical protein
MPIKKYVRSLVVIGVLFSASSRAEASSLLMVAEVRGIEQLANVARDMGENFDYPVDQQMIEAGLASSLGLSSLNGIDRQGIIRIGIFAEDPTFSEEPYVQIELPKENRSNAFIDAMKQVWTFQGSPLGTRFTIVPQPNAMVMLPVQELFVDFDDHVIRLATHTGALAPLPATLNEVNGVLALAMYPALISEMVTPVMEQQIESMRQMEEMTGSNEEFGAEQLESTMNTMVNVMRSLNVIGFGLNMSGDNLQMHTLLQADPDSMLGRIVDSMQQPSGRFLRAIPDNSFLAGAGHIVIPDELIDAYLSFLNSMWKDMPEMDQILPIMEQSMNMLKGQYGGDYAYSIHAAGSDGESFDIQQIWQIKDADRMQTMIDNYLQSMLDMVAELDELNEVEEELLTINPPRNYRGALIKGYTLNPSMGDPELEEVIREFVPMLLHLKTEYAFLDDVMLSSMGSPSGMNELIDRFMDGTGDSLANHPQIRAHFPSLPSDFTDLAVLKPVQLMQQLQAIAPAIPLQWVQDLAPAMASIASYSRVAGSDYHVVIDMDIAGLIEIIERVENAETSTPGQSFDSPGTNGSGEWFAGEKKRSDPATSGDSQEKRMR